MFKKMKSKVTPLVNNLTSEAIHVTDDLFAVVLVHKSGRTPHLELQIVKSSN